MLIIRILIVIFAFFWGSWNVARSQSFVMSDRLNGQIDSMMNKYDIPGLQLAIVKDEQMVYQQSYGYADRESETPVSDSSLFRIASISKPITYIAILQLMEEKKLTGDQLVFGPDGILSEDYEIPENSKIKKITVQQLLDHKSGWVNEPDDPMFWNLHLSQSQIIQRILSTRKPEYEPGAQYDYSNFGYCLLGRIIEKIAKTTYEEYIKENILLPCGITDMVVAGDTFEERSSNEVAYYSQEETGAYMMAVRRMDSHGGWIASATDLVKLLVHVDRNPKVQDIIVEQSMKNMYFSYNKWSHSGSLPGTTTLMVRQNDQWGYAILANTRTIPANEIIKEIQKIMDQYLQ